MNDPSRSWIATSPEASAAALRVLESGRYLLGDETAAIERELVRFGGADDAITVASGTDALAPAILAVGVETGDDVVVAPKVAA